MEEDIAMTTATHDTPIGALTLRASPAGLTRCTFGPVRRDRSPVADPTAQA